MIEKLLTVTILAMTPWGEWIIAIPAGLLLNLPFIPTVISAFTGNFLPVFIISILWKRLKKRLHKWQSRRQDKAQGFIKRYGMIGLILIAPMSVGVYVSSITALLAGVTPRRNILLHAFSLLFWGIFIIVLYFLGIEAWEILH